MASSGVKCFSTFFMQTCERVCAVVYSELTVDVPDEVCFYQQCQSSEALSTQVHTGVSETYR